MGSTFFKCFLFYNSKGISTWRHAIPLLLQVVQLQELFEVRHSVFIVGNAGTGKSMVWKSLFKANQLMKKKPMAVDLNPKAVTNNELFGIINPATREWKDGQFSQSSEGHT